MPPAKTAIVPAPSAASCAAESMPRARPETIDEVGVAEIAREHRRHFSSGDRGVARADDGDRRRRQVRRLAAHGEERRRRVGVPKPRRIERLADADEARAQADAPPASPLRPHAGSGCAPAAPRRRAREVRQRVERGLRRAEMIDQAAKRRRPDILAADQAQPGQPLLVGQRDAAGSIGASARPEGAPAVRLTACSVRRRSGFPRRPSAAACWRGAGPR